jgi:drug/metabolite transporter (DMT)-like permease
LSLSGTFSLLFFRFVIAVLFVGTHMSLQPEWHWSGQRSLLIELGVFFSLLLFSRCLNLPSARGSAELIVAVQPVLTALIVTYLLAERDHLYKWLGVAVSILSFFLMLHLIRTRNVARVSSLQYFLPPVSMLIAW